MNHNSRINRLTGFEKKEGFLWNTAIRALHCYWIILPFSSYSVECNLECYVKNLIIALNFDNDILHQKANVWRNTKSSNFETLTESWVPCAMTTNKCMPKGTVAISEESLLILASHNQPFTWGQPSSKATCLSWIFMPKWM